MGEIAEPNIIPDQIADDTAVQKNNPRQKRKHLIKSKYLKLYTALGITATAVFLLYFAVGFYYQKVFFPFTTINDIDVSGLTPEKAQELLNSSAAEYILTIVEDGDHTEQISGSDIGLYAEDDNRLQDIVDSQNILSWGPQSLREKKYSLDMAYDEQMLLSAVNTLSCMDKRNWVSPENAYITYVKGEGYKIVPEIPGSEILTGTFLEAAAAAIDHLDDTLSLRDAGVYRSPDISCDDAVLNEQFARLQPYSDMTVTYQFGSRTEILDSSTLSEWISLDKNGRLQVDEEAAAEFVKGLAKKYNTAYSPKTLETSYGETVTIKGGFYGWQIDRAAETEDLLQIIRDGKSVTREPDYLLSAATHDGADYGDTYVEINLTAQHLFYYKDGELLIESDFVSGNPSKGNATPAGAYAITYTERNATLKGQNYRTPVSYWMPFNGNIGMHDSSWRSSFGGTIYQTNGSHGCINLPPAVAKTIFENIEKGIPVLCYHLGGTGQTSGTSSSEKTASENNPAQSQEPGEGEVPDGTQPLPGEGEVPIDTQPLPDGTEAPADTQPVPDNAGTPTGTQPAPDGTGAPTDTQPVPEEGAPSASPEGNTMPPADPIPSA